MALRTSVGSGDWNTAGTWDTGVPGNGDTVTVAAGHTVTLNTDYSAITLGTITVNGTLECATTATAYLKTNADIVGSGTINCGSSGTPLPSSRSMTFDFAAAAKGINSIDLALNFYCWQPTNKYALTTGVEASGQTEIEVDRNVDEWQTFLTASGLTAEVHVNDVGGTLPDSESRTATMSGTTVTLGSGLTAQKETGSLVILVTRNIRVFNSTQSPIVIVKAFSVLGCEINGGSRSVNGGNCLEMSGVMANASTYGIIIVSGNLSGVITNVNHGIYMCSGISVTGIISGCGYAAWSSMLSIDYGRIAGCTYCLSRCYADLHKTTIECTTAVNRSIFISHDCSFSGTENVYYNTLVESSYSASYDHDSVAGAFKSWTNGGITVNEASDVPPGFDVSYKHTCKSASYWNYRQEKVLLMPGEAIKITGWFKLADDHTTYPPKLELIDPASDPLLGGTALDNDEVGTPGGSASWQEVSVSYANTAAYAKVLLVRASCKRASGDVYEAWEIEKVTADDIATAVRTELTTELARILKGLPDAIPGENGGLPTTNGTVINQTVGLTAGQSVGISGDLSATMKTSVQAAADAAVTANTKIGAIETKTANIPASPAAVGSEMALADGAITASKIAAAALSGKGDWNTVAPDNASAAATLALVQCDKVAILVDGVYWMSYRVAGTATEIMRKQMLDANGDPVASITTPVAALQGAD